MATKRALSYARVSTEDQVHGYSLSAQSEVITEYALRNNLQIVKSFQEDKSGQSLDRPYLNEARAMLRQGQADAIIAYDDDRLTRVPEHSIILRSEFETLGVELHYVRKGQIRLDDTTHQILADIGARMAQEEAIKFARRSRMAKRSKVSTGKVIVAQRPPFGYDLVGDTLVVNEIEAEIVRLIFRLYTIERWSIKKIAQHLSEQKIPTAADKIGWYKKSERGTWAYSVIRRILGRETYIGTWYWGKQHRKWVIVAGKRIRRVSVAPKEEWIAVEVPAIIDKATFDKAQVLLKENIKTSSRSTKDEYLMAKRLTCGVCGLPVYAERKKDKRWGYTFYYYHCASKSSHHPAPNCGLPHFRAKELDATIWAWIKKLLDDPDFMLELLNKTLEEMTAAQVGAQDELAKLETDIKRQQLGLERLFQELALCASDIERIALENTRISIRARLEELLTRKAEIEAELMDVPQKDEVTELMKSIQLYREVMDIEDDPPFEIKKNWVEELNLRGVISGTRKEKSVTLLCHLGQFLLTLGTPPPTRWVCKLEIRQTLELPNQRHWADI